MATPRLAPAARLLLALAYPVLIFLGLQWLEPRAVAALLALALLLRHFGLARDWLRSATRMECAVLVMLLGWATATVLSNHETMLRLYPMVMGLGVLAVFAWSLARPPTAIERFARLRTPHLSEPAVAWTRRVTQVWCVFLLINCLIAGWTALFAPRDTWALYNGLIAYLLMGVLFAGEWLLRKWRLPTA